MPSRSDTAPASTTHQPVADRTPSGQDVFPRVTHDERADGQRPAVRDCLVVGGLLLVYMGALFVTGIARLVLAPLPE